MRIPVATRITIVVAAVLLLAALSSGLAVFVAWRIERLLGAVVSDSVPSVRAAEELEIALLDERGLLASFMIDAGNPAWLQRLETQKPVFRHWLEKAGQTAHTEQERESLKTLAEIHRAYELKRDEAIRSYTAGDVERARNVLLGEVETVYQRAYRLCEEDVAANEQFVITAGVRAKRQAHIGAVVVGLGVIATLSLGLLLFGLFFRTIFLPLRKMAADARSYAHAGLDDVQPVAGDELRAVGIYLSTLMSDVTDTRANLARSRAQLLNAEKLATVGKLAASVAHEIRNPLTAIRMWLFSLRRAVGSDPGLDSKFDIISEEITRLESIVRNVLDFSRPPELKLGRHRIEAIADRTLELLAPRFSEKRLEVMRSDATPLPEATVDAEQIKQVLINVLENAIVASPSDGKLRVAVDVETDRADASMIVVRVEDSGAGIPPDVAGRLFEPFFTTRDDGTGLGLSIAARIMNRHGGRLRLESTAPTGSCFAIWIPIVPQVIDEQDSRLG